MYTSLQMVFLLCVNNTNNYRAVIRYRQSYVIATLRVSQDVT